MGLRLLGSSGSTLETYETVERYPNDPDPKIFEIIQTCESGDFLVARVKYPNCTNYEGEKILVFEGLTAKQLKEMNFLDPHFLKTNVNLIARFRPSYNGWHNAINFVTKMHEVRR